MYDGFPWIKFIILCVCFGVPIIIFTPGIKWKLMFTMAVPLGVGFALAGYRLRK